MSERKDEASQALDIYRALADPIDRASFLKDFEGNGGGGTHGSLKFALKFSKDVSNVKQVEIAATENYITRSCLLHLICSVLKGLTQKDVQCISLMACAKPYSSHKATSVAVEWYDLARLQESL